MRVVSDPEADEELEAAALWYEERQAGLGDAFLESRFGGRCVSFVRGRQRPCPNNARNWVFQSGKERHGKRIWDGISEGGAADGFLMGRRAQRRGERREGQCAAPWVIAAACLGAVGRRAQ